MSPKQPEQNRKLLFSLRPNSSYKFQFVYTPIKPGPFDFEIAFKLPGSDNEAIRALTRQVRCLCTNPRFLMEPLSG